MVTMTTTSELEVGSKEYYQALAEADLAQRCDDCRPRTQEVAPGLYVLHGTPAPRDYYTNVPYPCEHFEPPMFNYDFGFPAHNGIVVLFPPGV
jgi:hypothetical protein